MQLTYCTLVTLALVLGGLEVFVISSEDIPLEEDVFWDESEPLSASSTVPSLQPLPGRMQAALAKKLLQKWGYMQTQQSDGHWEFIDWRKQLTNPLLSVEDTAESLRDDKTDEDDENSWSSTSKDKFHEGVHFFQKRFNLPVTGDLDERTIQLMKQPRCAVPDNIDDSYSDGKDTATPVTKEQRKVKQSGRNAQGNSLKKSFAALKTVKLDRVFGLRRGSKIRVFHSKDKDVKQTRTTAPGNNRHTTPALSTVLRQTSHMLPNRTATELESVTEIMEVRTEIEYSVSDITTEVHDTQNLDSKDQIASDIHSTEVIQPQSLEEQSLRRRRNIPQFLHNVLQRSKRTSSSVCSSGYTTSRAITWRILKKNAADSNYAPLSDSTDFTRATLRTTISEAFRRWSEVSMLTFAEQNSGSSTSVDIWIQFVSDGSSTTPYGCRSNGCFSGSEMALSFQSYGRAYMYFRDDPSHPWAYQSTSSSTRDLLTVAVHEIGHILCLDHDFYTYNSIMSPVYSPPSSNFQVQIDSTARRDMKNKYGACNKPFVAFDWVRPVNGVKKYSSYIFRGDHYWLWENSNQQTRYGDPRTTTSSSSEWPGVPSNLQAVVQILPKRSSLNLLYFFAGGRSYLYDQTYKRVIQQGSISSMWPAKAGSGTAIPDNIKAAYFDKRDGNVYFFSSTHVYAYDYSSSNKGCCNSIMSIPSAFPGQYSSYPALETNIDLAYYSIADKTLYFLKGTEYWESTYNPSHTSVYNSVKRQQSNWDEKWQYICEVE